MAIQEHGVRLQGDIEVPVGYESLEEIFEAVLSGKVSPSTDFLVLAERWRAQKKGTLQKYDARRAAVLAARRP